jgi:nucleoside-diphosphate-sugar epimerase
MTASHPLPSAAPLKIVETFAGKHLLVTGITGFVGKVWLAMVLDQIPEIGRLNILVRGQRNCTAEARVRHILDRSPVFRPLRQKHGRDFESFIAARISVLDGDLQKPMCGFDDDQVARLAADLDAVVHIAGLTDFAPDPMEAINVNLHGSVHIADLTARLRVPRLVHVSTCFVAGNVSSPSPEAITPGVSPNGTHFDVHYELKALESAVAASGKEHPSYSREAKQARVDAGMRRAEALGWPNIYTFSKGLTEHLLAQRSDVHVTTVRPAIVECARDYPFEGWNEGINTSGPLTWLSGGFTRKLPIAGDNIFDVVPVDTVCRGLIITTAAALQDRAAEVYHLSSGDINPALMSRVIELTGLAYRKHYRRWDASPMERTVLRYLDVIPSNTDPRNLKALPAIANITHSVRDVLGKFNLDKHVPESLRRRAGEQINDWIMKGYVQLTAADRTLRRVQGMFELFRPFTFDNSYLFLSANIVALNALLDADDLSRFGYDVASLDWRHYWVDVQMPGLMKWSYPLMRGEKPQEDPPRAEQLALLSHEEDRQRLQPRLDPATQADHLPHSGYNGYNGHNGNNGNNGYSALNGHALNGHALNGHAATSDYSPLSSPSASRPTNPSPSAQ